MGLSRKTFVNFRNSILTRVLQPFLDGKAYVVMLCCASPSAIYTDCTRKTLEFALYAKQIKNKPKINVIFAKRSVKKQVSTPLTPPTKAKSKNQPKGKGTGILYQKKKKISVVVDVPPEWNVDQDSTQVVTPVDKKMSEIEEQWKLIRNSYESMPPSSIVSTFFSEHDAKFAKSLDKEAISLKDYIVNKKSFSTEVTENDESTSMLSSGNFTNLCSDIDDNSITFTLMGDKEEDCETLYDMLGNGNKRDLTLKNANDENKKKQSTLFAPSNNLSPDKVDRPEQVSPSVSLNSSLFIRNIQEDSGEDDNILSDKETLKQESFVNEKNQQFLPFASEVKRTDKKDDDILSSTGNNQVLETRQQNAHEKIAIPCHEKRVGTQKE